nr:hypothetical protein [uncultured Oscillibacter sp.]
MTRVIISNSTSGWLPRQKTKKTCPGGFQLPLAVQKPAVWEFGTEKGSELWQMQLEAQKDLSNFVEKGKQNSYI